MLKTIPLTAFAILALTTLTSRADFINAPITWGVPTNIAGDTDVNTSGSLVFAYNFGQSGVADTIVNGVAFTPYAVTNVNFISTSNFYGTDSEPGASFANVDGSSDFAPFSHLSSAYRSLLGSSVITSLPPTLELQLQNLTPGQVYLLQIWTSYSGTSSNLTEVIQATDQIDQVTLQYNTLASSGGLGQWVTGTFTPSSSVEQIGFTGSDAPLISALQVRAVPEPAVSALLAAGAAGLAVLWRRKKNIKQG